MSMLIHEAVASGKTKIVQKALKGGLWRQPANPNARDAKGEPPLAYAADLVMAEILVNSGADVNGGKKGEHNDYRVRSPLFATFQNDRREVAEFLLSRGAAPDLPNGEEGISVLYAAARKGMVDWVDLLLKYRAHPNVRVFAGSAEIPANDTPLHAASYSGNVEVLKRLLAAPGIDVNPVNHPLEKTPLSVAAGRGHLQTVKLLFDAGASVRIGRPLHSVLSGPTEMGRFKNTASERERILLALLERGADVNEKTAVSGAPLHIAARHGGLSMVPLLEHGADVNAIEPRSGHTPLHAACWSVKTPHGDPVATVRLLLQRGADPTLAAEDSRTPSNVIETILSRENENDETRRRCYEILSLLAWRQAV